MKAKVACMVCEDEIGSFSCSNCGKVVGLKCFDKNSGLCVNCKSGKKLEIGKIY